MSQLKFTAEYENTYLGKKTANGKCDITVDEDLFHRSRQDQNAWAWVLDQALEMESSNWKLVSIKQVNIEK